MSLAQMDLGRVKPFSLQGARLHLRTHWQRWILIVLATVVFTVSLVVLPFLVQRTSNSWLDRTNRTNDPDRPLNLFERYWQFNVDISHWIAEARYFPFYYQETGNLSRVNRPLYPAVTSSVGRIITFVTEGADFKRAFTEPNSLRTAFLASTLVNYAMFVAMAQLLYSTFTRRLPYPVSFIAAIMTVLFSGWLTTVAQISNAPVHAFVISATLYLFERYLLGDQQAAWGQIAVSSLVIGSLFLGVQNYSALFACWLWALCLRRYRTVSASLVLHVIPLLLWIGILQLGGIQYNNLEADAYRQGVWVLDLIGQGKWQQIYSTAIETASLFIGGLPDSFGAPVLLLAGYALVEPRQVLSESHKRMALLGLLGVLLFWVLAWAPGNRSNATFFLIFPLAAAGLYSLALQIRDKISSWHPSLSGAQALSVIITLIILANVIITWRYHTVTESSFVWRPALQELTNLGPRLRDLSVLTGPEY